MIQALINLKALLEEHERLTGVKPRTQAELDAQLHEDARRAGLSVEEYVRQWNQGADWADAHWADEPREAYIPATVNSNDD